MTIMKREKPLLAMPIYSPKMTRKPKRHKNLNHWICLIQRSTSFGAQNPLINARHITRSDAASSHFTHHHITDRKLVLRLFGCTSSRAWGASVQVRLDDSLSRPTLEPSNHPTTTRRPRDDTWPTDP